MPDTPVDNFPLGRYGVGMNKPAKPKIVIARHSRAVRISSAVLRRLVAFVAQAEGCRLGSVDLALVEAEGIADLNRRYLHHAGATDVLSFDLSDGQAAGISAQLVVCADVAAREGRLRGHGGRRELMLYVVHGLLHLMGYEDHTVRGAARMHAREDEILADFGTGVVFARPRKQRSRAR